MARALSDGNRASSGYNQSENLRIEMTRLRSKRVALGCRRATLRARPTGIAGQVVSAWNADWHALLTERNACSQAKLRAQEIQRDEYQNPRDETRPSESQQQIQPGTHMPSEPQRQEKDAKCSHPDAPQGTPVGSGLVDLASPERVRLAEQFGNKPFAKSRHKIAADSLMVASYRMKSAHGLAICRPAP